MEQIIKDENGGYITSLNTNVERTAVSFKNRFGMTLCGDLYTAKMLDKEKKHPALIVGAP